MKFFVIVVPIIAFLSGLSLANLYALQKVGTKTKIANISINSKIACGIACKTTENCIGFWYNQTCDLFTDVYNGSENSLYLDTSKQLLYPKPKFLLAQANPSAVFIELESEKPEKSMSNDFTNYDCFVLFNEGKSVMFHSKLSKDQQVYLYNFEDQSVEEFNEYKNPNDHMGGTCTSGPYNQLVMAGGTSTSNMEIFMNGTWKSLKSLQGSISHMCLTFMHGNLDLEIEVEFYIVGGSLNSNPHPYVYGYKMYNTEQDDETWQESTIPGLGLESGCIAYKDKNDHKVSSKNR